MQRWNIRWNLLALQIIGKSQNQFALVTEADRMRYGPSSMIVRPKTINGIDMQLPGHT